MLRFKSLGAMVGVVLIGLVSWSAIAGQLSPPPGPLSATGHTLDEIYDKIDELVATSGFENGPWDSLVTGTLGGTPTQLIPGSGILHAVIMCEGRGLEFYSTNGTVYIADLIAGPGGSHQRYVLDIPFDGGLSVRLIPGFGSSSRCTLLYKSTAP